MSDKPTRQWVVRAPYPDTFGVVGSGRRRLANSEYIPNDRRDNATDSWLRSGRRKDDGTARQIEARARARHVFFGRAVEAAE